MRATGQTRPARSFWWDRQSPVEADELRAVIFDADSVLADIEREGDVAARNALVDLVMSLFCAGIWVGVVSTRPREWVEALVRQLVGDGLVETIVTIDDLSETRPDDDADLYRLALWELGITPQNALAVAGSRRGLRAAVAAELLTVGYDGPDPLLAPDCQRAHRRWSIEQRARAA